MVFFRAFQNAEPLQGDGGVGAQAVLSAHRKENIDTEKNFTTLFTAINAMAEKYDLPILYACHPRSKKRPEALDKACFVLAGIDEGGLLQAVETAVAMHDHGDHGTPVPDYVAEDVSTKVVKLIQPYTGVVNKVVWRK